jgi:GH25 family lysozyme M1 (1,4-beta-N-acetylmuramidase)
MTGVTHGRTEPASMTRSAAGDVARPVLRPGTQKGGCLMSTCRGLDVSAYQGTQDWGAHRKEGVTFAFAKASEGEHTRDTKFATHIKGIKAAGLVPGAYHFGWPNQDVATEAANYVAAVKPYAGKGFTHWLDLERYGDGRNYSGRSAAQIKTWVGNWTAAVRKAFPGQRVGVYTSGSDLSAGHVPKGTTLWYPAYPWGAADYSRAEAAARPNPSGWTPLVWQFTSQPLDRSIAYLSAAALRAWATGSTISEEDDMPIRTSLGKTDRQSAPWSKWTAVEWNKEYADPDDAHSDGTFPGYVAPVESWADFGGRLVIDGLLPGDQVQIEYQVHDWRNGKSSGVWEEIIADQLATPGAQFISVPFSKGLKKGQHVYVAVQPIPAEGRASAPAPVISGGRWTVRQDKD